MLSIALLSFSLLLGLIASQLLPAIFPQHQYVEYQHLIRLLTAVALGFIMIRVGYGFDIQKDRLKSYGWDYLIAMTSATFPWLFVAAYFIFIIADGVTAQVWKESLLSARFAAPTSAGILFTMLMASGLAATWVFQKIRVLAIFDDLDTVLLMVLLQVLFIGWQWQLVIVLIPILLLLWAAWHYLHRVHIPIGWTWVMGYAMSIALISELIYHSSRAINSHEPIHIEVLLPAFVLGCMIARSNPPHRSHEQSPRDILKSHSEKLATFVISMMFMLLVGLSMPDFNHVNNVSNGAAESMSIGWIAIHTVIVTFIANLGKLFPLFCYRREAHWKERLALSVGMFPRGEVGAGVLVISMSYGIGGAMILIAMLSLTLNLLLTGVYVFIVKSILVHCEHKECLTKSG